MQHLKDNPCHGVIFVLDANCRKKGDLKYCLKALKECFNGLLRESRLIIYVNKLPTDFALEDQNLFDQEEKDTFRKEKTQDLVQYVVGYLLGESEVHSFQNFVCNMAESRHGEEALKTAISLLPSVPMNPGRFWTWTGARNWYRSLETDSLDNEKIQKRLIEKKQNELEGLEQDIRWHTKCIEDNRVAQKVFGALGTCAAVLAGAGFLAGLATTIAGGLAGIFEANITNHKTAGETKQNQVLAKQAELRSLQNHLAEQIQTETARAQRLAAEFTELEAEISQNLSAAA